ncbi:putative RIP metalloprotease RseP [Aeromicrobium marinum DSM 15272]|uniref:RIP metalloprotease RseP n=1 Tax=Aeromicrobium marinum DSM 15272 TaxID=585531 RepID=E2SD73_9ACTN|nr:site-2 protease family protein [Aeromicrobium marinum]EFQ83176.1 putative RIP metalloprotease RseP [Aeromicrobium marinum DSM 15272]
MNAVIYTLGVLVFIVGVVVSIALHECGHMVPARRFGVKVTQFFVGFGRTVWSTRRGETEYGFKAVPLGGYVKLVGMLPPAKDTDPHLVRQSNTGLFTQLVSDARAAEYELVADEDMDRLFYRLPWWKKVIVMAGGPLVNVAIAAVLFAVVLIGFGAQVPTTTVQSVSDCAISDAEAGRACTDADPPTPAREAGLLPGDVITSFNGDPVDGWEELTRSIRANGDRAAAIGFDRGGAPQTVTVQTSVIERIAVDDPDRVEDVGFLGVSPTFANERQGPLVVGEVMWETSQATVEAILRLPERMVGVVKAAVGGERENDGPISVVGASRVAGELVTLDEPTWAERAQRLLSLLASLNLFLALFNFVPLLPLDGGHIAGALWEGIRNAWARLRGRPEPGPVDVARMLPVAYAVGLTLIVMSVILIYADIVNPISIT